MVCYSFCDFNAIAIGCFMSDIPSPWDTKKVRQIHEDRSKSYSDNLDSNFNFRCNSELKEDFKKLCKRDQSSPTVALKRYMLSCLRKGRID